MPTERLQQKVVSSTDTTDADKQKRKFVKYMLDSGENKAIAPTLQRNATRKILQKRFPEIYADIPDIAELLPPPIDLTPRAEEQKQKKKKYKKRKTTAAQRKERERRKADKKMEESIIDYINNHEVDTSEMTDEQKAYLVKLQNNENRKHLTVISPQNVQRMEANKVRNAHLINIVSAGINRVDMSDTEAVKDRIVKFLELSSADGVVATIEGLASYLGISMVELQNRINGKKETVPEVREILKTLKESLKASIVAGAMDGSLNPISSIFVLRNNFGYTNDDRMNAAKDVYEEVEKESITERAKKYENLPDD